MDSYYFFEEEIMTKMHSTLTQKFNLDNYTATELTLEIMNIIEISSNDGATLLN